MDLLPADLKSRLTAPPEHRENNPLVVAKFLLPDSFRTWYVTHGVEQGEDFIFHGYILDKHPRWGNFTLQELTQQKNKHNSGVILDTSFKQKLWEEVQKEIARCFKLS